MTLLLFGRNHPDKRAAFTEQLDMDIKRISVFPQWKRTEYLDKVTPGICRVDQDGEKLIIEMLGYFGASRSQHLFIKHEGTHEVSHACADILPSIFAENPNGIIKNGIFALIKNFKRMLKMLKK